MEKILNKSLRYVDQAELFHSSSKTILARSTLDKIETLKTLYASGYGLRVVKNGAIGFSYFSDEKHAEHAIKQAVKTAKLSKKERYSLPTKKRYRRVKTLDRSYLDIDENKLVNQLFLLMQGVEEGGAEPNQAEVSVTISHTHIVNSEGIDVKADDSLGFAYVVAKKKEATGSEYFLSKSCGFDMEDVGRHAAAIANKSVGAKPVTFGGDIILGVDAFQEFFGVVIIPAINGENVRRKKSIWTDKIGETVMSESVTIYDDPFIPWGIGTSSFDDEGVPCTRKPIIDRGVLHSFLYDTRTANLVKKESTGNGFRSGFSGLPNISVTNIVMKPKHRENVFDTEKAVYVRELMGFHNLNPMTGDFALSISTGFFVEHGELTKPIRGCMLVGNFFDIMKNIKGFHKEDVIRGWIHVCGSE